MSIDPYRELLEELRALFTPEGIEFVLVPLIDGVWIYVLKGDVSRALELLMLKTVHDMYVKFGDIQLDVEPRIQHCWCKGLPAEEYHGE